MADSAIEWTDKVWNPVRGCTKVSPGCAHCYAETFAERWRGIPGHPYEQGFDLRLVPEKLAEPLSWKKPRRVFVNSMSDLFQDGVPESYIDRAFAVMALAPRHTFQVLTKRADRIHGYLNDPLTPSRIDAVFLSNEFDLNGGRACLMQRGQPEGWPLQNVWLGVSVENQHFADERIPLLLQTPAAVRFLSCEPLLGPLELTDAAICDRLGGYISFLDWCIVGGESGPGARPFNLEWARSIVQQCQAAGVACFIKQLGASPEFDEGCGDCDPCAAGQPCPYANVRLRMELHSRKGGDMAEWPDDLRVREFPRG